MVQEVNKIHPDSSTSEIHLESNGGSSSIGTERMRKAFLLLSALGRKELIREKKRMEHRQDASKEWDA